jgi:hypothetical protein
MLPLNLRKVKLVRLPRKRSALVYFILLVCIYILFPRNDRSIEPSVTSIPVNYSTPKAHVKRNAMLDAQRLSDLYNSMQRMPGVFPHTVVYNARDLFNLTEITNEHTYNFTLNPVQNVPECSLSTNIGTSNTRPTRLLALALVMVAPEFFEKRTAIRETWANSNQTANKIRVLFVLGLADNTRIADLIRHESAKFNDIIQEDFYDSYYRITLKVIGALKWVAEFCPNVEFVLRINDHVVVNTPKLVRFLNSTFAEVQSKTSRFSKYENTIWGRIWNFSMPDRNPKHKWHVSRSDYNFSHFLPYMEGTFFIMTRDLAVNVYNMSRYVYWPRFSIAMEV